MKNKRRIDPRYFLNETVNRDSLDEAIPLPSPKRDEENVDELNVGPISQKDQKENLEEHDDECDCPKCPPKSKKKKKKGKENGRELIQGEKELSEDEGGKN